MPIYERLHNGKKQWCYRCYYTDFNGDRIQKHSKWFNARKEAIAAELLITKLIVNTVSKLNCTHN